MDNLIIDNDISTGIITDERMKPFLKYLARKDVTDVDWNGKDLILKTIYRKNIKIDHQEHNITVEFIRNFVQHVANSVSKHFNKSDNRLDAQVGPYRITCVHESVSHSGTAVFIRKTTKTPRLYYSAIIDSNYCSEPILNLLINCYYAKFNIIIAGEPGVGKTEFAKFLSLFTPDDDRLITIEDTPEWHYSELKPNADCVELMTNKNYSYSDALEDTVRMNADRIMLSEVRSIEVKSLITCWSQGAKGVTSLHTDHVKKIPDRILNLMPTKEDAERMKNNVYENLDIGILISDKIDRDNNKYRYIEQVYFFDRDEEQNKYYPIVENGKLITNKIPEFKLYKLAKIHIQDPFKLYEPLQEVVNEYTEK